ncbi:CDP-diacylglycerol--serine O-phosphatidyltransferase [Prosthecochloris sp.]|uniref:CDP-diacylglycerol--serine O-phosphatidyltransferase n=1 Tax=Prosthecochloris sp. TaxID=290513 RepID=UPI0025E4320C|nr:CDP-diacylglycerol--serine O-phosphatidyltransferase [Prosthecochloris sp.]
MRNEKKKDNFRERRTGLPLVSRSFVPAVLTVMNMVCGYIAIVMSGSDRFVVAGWCIVLAAFFDAADGFVARMTDTTSRFGIELDSLSDLVSFGVAPAYLVYKFGLEDIGAVKGIILSSMLVVGGGLRLARFNAGVLGCRKDFFCGLPIPAQALTVAGFVLWMDAENILNHYQLQNALSLLTVVLAFLMISRVNYDAFPEPTFETVREKPLQTGFYLTIFFCVLIYQAKALFLAMLLYILLGVLRSLSLFFKQIVLQR